MFLGNFCEDGRRTQGEAVTKHLITLVVEFNEKTIVLDDVVESLLEHLDQVEGVTDFDLWKTEERKDDE